MLSSEILDGVCVDMAGVTGIANDMLIYLDL